MRIFLSYRREDASAWAGRLRDALAARFGEDQVFQDVVGVRPGQDFTDAIDDALERSDAVLVVIGPAWSTAAGADGAPRLADPDDYVRYELRAALARGSPVIPVLVGGAKMPGRALLPDDLDGLAVLQAVTLRDEVWHRDVEGLLESLGAAPAPVAARRRRWVTVALLVVGVAVAAVTAVVLSRDDSDGSSGDAGGPPGNTGAVVSTSLDPLSELDECDSPASSQWTSLGVTGSGGVGPADDPVSQVDVLSGYYRAGEGGGWDMLLAVETTNLLDATRRNYWSFYKLTVGGPTFVPYCFSDVGGHNPADPGDTSEVLIGFATTLDPTVGGALLVDMIGDRGRIELVPG